MLKEQFDKVNGEHESTTGKTILEISDIIRQCLPRNMQDLTVLSWHTSTDVDIFHRILAATDNKMFVEKVKHKQPINVADLAANMLPVPPDDEMTAKISTSAGLSALHKKLWPNKYMNWHRAESDTRGMCNVVKAIYRRCRSSFIIYLFRLTSSFASQTSSLGSMTI